jgi:NAD(P)-dependent dehydrogenase (short-subunit alcohol dehydrogenase family)
MGLIVLVCEASAGIGRLSANAIAQGGHTVYAALRRPAAGRSAQVVSIRTYARRQGIDMRVVVLDLSSQHQIDKAVAAITAEHGRIDVVVHNACCKTFGPTEAFTPEQLALAFDRVVLSAQRVNRAVLPSMRACGSGLVLWICASSCVGGAPPYLAPFVAAKAALDALAFQYGMDLVPWGIETTIVVPGLLDPDIGDPSTTVAPADHACAASYTRGPAKDVARRIRHATKVLIPPGAHPAVVAGAVAAVVETPPGERPFRVHIDPVGDGASVAFGVIDRLRDEMLARMGLTDLLNSNPGSSIWRRRAFSATLSGGSAFRHRRLGALKAHR